MTLLAINIPTYERLDSFSSIINEIENEVNSLSAPYKGMIEINVIDNNSSSNEEKRALCELIAKRSNIKIGYSSNKINVGADRNILNCSSANICAKFTWVLGDDDHIVSGCIPQVVSLLLANENDLGLLIFTGDYICSGALKDKIFTSYEQFARFSFELQPHILIAHTLISCNIFRTIIFDYDEATYVIDKLTPRLGLSANFAHIRGIVKGLNSSTEEYKIITPSFKSLDTSRRLPGEVDLSDQMAKIYYFYFLWLLSEFGVRLDDIEREDSMWWLFKSK